MLSNQSGFTLFAAVASAIYFYRAVVSQNENRVQRKVKISKLVVYPIKSCEGIEFDSLTTAKTGFQYDRSFLVIDENNLFLTQRKSAKMALIRTSFDNGFLVVNAPNMRSLRVPLKRDTNSNKPTINVKVWDDVCETETIDDTINQWFSEYLERPNVKLVRMKHSFIRPTDPKLAPNGQTLFSDGFPFLLANERSLDEVNMRLSNKVPMNRFRPNIVVRGAGAFAEDNWKTIQIVNSTNKKSLKMTVASGCSRCIMPNIVQEEGVVEDKLPVSAALTMFRKGEDLGLTDPKLLKQVFFGSNLDHEAVEGFTVSVGDEIVVTK